MDIETSDNSKDYVKKFPKSKNNFQCLGPCYPANTLVIHPTYLETVTDKNHAFCNVNEWEYVDPVTGKKKDEITDMCTNPIDARDIKKISKEIESHMLTPFIEFSAEHFLKMYYNIYSFEDSLAWIDSNNSTPLNTRIRIINSSLRVFGKNIEMFDGRFVDFFVELLKKNHMSKIYNSLSPYIDIDMSQGEASIMITEKMSNVTSRDTYSVEKTNYIIKTFLEKNEMTKFLTRYLKHKRDDFSNPDVLEIMTDDFIEYCIGKISLTLNK